MQNHGSELFEPLAKGSISDEIKDRIIRAIVSGELKPGDKIPTEVEFHEKLGVGRNAVREAIKVLVAYGVLEIRRAEGTFVVESFRPNLMDPMIYGVLMSNRTPMELLDFKLSLLGMIIVRDIAVATEDEIRELEILWSHFNDAMLSKRLSMEKRYAACEEFNRYLGEISKNPMIIQLNEAHIQVASYTRKACIRASIERGCPNALPDSYFEDVQLIKNRDRAVVPAVLDKKMQMWKELLDIR